MHILQNEIIINSPANTIWTAITDADVYSKWMKDVVVETDWKVGSQILYVCYDENGKILSHEGIEMIWDGEIKTLNKDSEFTCIYTDYNNGLEEESYIIEKLDEKTSKVIIKQVLSHEDAVAIYDEGTKITLQNLKDFTENSV
jgi:uncharacterized protein YndB with AHSA1/START domain